MPDGSQSPHEWTSENIWREPETTQVGDHESSHEWTGRCNRRSQVSTKPDASSRREPVVGQLDGHEQDEP